MRAHELEVAGDRGADRDDALVALEHCEIGLERRAVVAVHKPDRDRDRRDHERQGAHGKADREAAPLDRVHGGEVHCGCLTGGAGGAFGSIMGRNAFQRPRAEAVKLLTDIMDIYADVAQAEAAYDAVAFAENEDRD